jgi:MFS family permease
MMLLLVANFFGGALGGGVGIAQLHMVNLLSPKNGRGMAIAVHWTIIGLMAAAGPLIGGMVMDYMTKNPSGITLFTGLEFSYMHMLLLIFMAVVVFVAAPMMLKLKIRAGELPLNEVFGSIKVGNPMRGISIVSDIYQTALGLTPENIDDRWKKNKVSMEHKKDGYHDHKVR